MLGSSQNVICPQICNEGVHYQSGGYVCVSVIRGGCGRSAFNYLIIYYEQSRIHVSIDDSVAAYHENDTYFGTDL